MMRDKHVGFGVLGAILVVGLACLPACSDDEEEKTDPSAACDSMCKGAGFTGSRVDAQPHETNCFCTGATGTVTAAACTDMCSKATGKPGKTFKSGATTDNACQCQ